MTEGDKSKKSKQSDNPNAIMPSYILTNCCENATERSNIMQHSTKGEVHKATFSLLTMIEPLNILLLAVLNIVLG